jgi:predicted transposase YbfD/YdcC
MSHPKGKVPAHIKPKHFQHPESTNRLISILAKVDDPRKPACNFKYCLVTILFISLLGVLCGAKDWEEIVQIAEGMINWIGKYVDISTGIPSKKTLKRVMSLIPTNTLTELLQSICANVKSLDGDIIAIDGKTLRGSKGWNKNDRPLHLLHAWSTEYGVCLGQISVDEKSNEITAFPELIASLELKGTIVTADALNTQKKAAEAVISKGADYILPVKENHKTLLDDIQLLFQEADDKKFKGIDAATSHSLEKSAGRVEERLYELLDATELPDIKAWASCSSVGRVTRTRTKGGKTSKEVCFYITSLSLDSNIEKLKLLCLP